MTGHLSSLLGHADLTCGWPPVQYAPLYHAAIARARLDASASGGATGARVRSRVPARADRAACRIAGAV